MHIGQYDIEVKDNTLTLTQEDVKDGKVIHINDRQGLIELANAIYDSFGIPHESKKPTVHKMVTAILGALAVPTNVKGYNYLREAVKLAIKSPPLLTRTTHGLYPMIAYKFDSEGSRVERTIRHAIEVSWQNSSKETISEVFGYYPTIFKSKPTNLSFITIIADKIRFDLGIEDVENEK